MNKEGSKINEPISNHDTVSRSTFDCEEDRKLDNILSSPEKLANFEQYLQSIHAHENLLFIEALAELRHEKINIGAIVQRIWKTFLAPDAPLELNVKEKSDMGEFIESHPWPISSRAEALKIFSSAETEVKIFLNEQIHRFDKIYGSTGFNIHEPTCQRYQKRVVIIGGGFTGFTVASILDPMPRFHVTLIDAKDSFEYTPGIIKLLVRPEETSSLRVRHDAYVKNGRVLIGYAERIVDDAKSVKVNNEYVPFDYLVIATGSTYSSKLKSFDTSALYRLSELTTKHNELKGAETVLIIGGGLVGCELASAIATHQNKKKITIVDSHPRLVQRSSVKLQASAYAYLTSLGVDIVLNEKIVDFDSTGTNSYLGCSGKRYSGYDKVFVATGTTPCSDILQNEGDRGFENCVDHWGRLKVKSTLQLNHCKYKHIFAGGDVTNIMEEKTGYAATLAGVCIARNICRLEKGKEPLCQGTKGTLPAPTKPLCGIESHGGVGRKRLNSFQKAFSFLNPSWAALKYFDEQEFLNIVQGEASLSASSVIGKRPKVLDLSHNSFIHNDSHSIYSFISSSGSVNHNNKQISGRVPSSFKTTNLSGKDILTSIDISANNCTCMELAHPHLHTPPPCTSTTSISLPSVLLDHDWSTINSQLASRPSVQRRQISSDHPNTNEKVITHRKINSQ